MSLFKLVLRYGHKSQSFSFCGCKTDFFHFLTIGQGSRLRPNLRQCDLNLHLVEHVRPANLLLCFFYTGSGRGESKNLQSGTTGGRPMFVREGGNGE